MKVFILGGEGNGLVIAAALTRKYDGINVAFLNDVNDVGAGIGKFKKIFVEGRTIEVEQLLKKDNTYVLSAYGGFNNPKKTLDRLHSLNIPRDKWFTFIDDTAVIPHEFCNIQQDTFIGPLVQLSPNVEIGPHCSMFGNSFVGHDTVIGEFCHIATNAVIGSSVTIGEGVHIGINSSVIEHIKIGNNSIIGAGAVVVKDVPDNAIVVGNPARVLRYRE